MKSLKIKILGAFILLSGLTALYAFKAEGEDKSGLKWYTDLNEAHKLSIKTKKPIFGFFTGSDWCGWCHKLQRDVFAKEEFIKWAKDNVILLEIDFPKRKVLPEALRKQNQDLQAAFKVMGYPTVWFFNASKDEKNNYKITALGQTGYPQGAEIGKEEKKFLEAANKIIGKK